MKIEVRGPTDSLRRLERELSRRFGGVEFDTSWMEILIVNVLSTVEDCDRVKEFVDAYCAGAVLPWKVSSS